MFKSQIAETQKNLELLSNNKDLIEIIDAVVVEIFNALSSGLPVLVFGNGGSASDALHITGELVGKFKQARSALNVICLNSNVTVITAWSNDFEFDTVFSRQVEAHSKPNGICWGLSTSGKSISVVNALRRAKELGMLTILLTGQDGGSAKYFSDYKINVPSLSTPRIQELHLPIYHYICEQIELKFTSEPIN